MELQNVFVGLAAMLMLICCPRRLKPRYPASAFVCGMVVQQDAYVTWRRVCGAQGRRESRFGGTMRWTSPQT